MSAEHPFAATIEQMRRKPEEGGGFARLNDQQKWEWHADVYAFEKIVLNRECSPCDPNNRWFNAHLVRIAERYYRAKFIEPRERANAVRDSADQRQGRALVNGWARRRGYDSIDEYAEGEQIPLIGEGSAYLLAVTEIAAQVAAEKQRAWGKGAHGRTSLDEVRAALGVDAKPAKTWTPEEMRHARVELGLEADEPSEATQ